MNKKSSDIIKSHIRPDDELIKKTKENAIASPKTKSNPQIIKICIVYIFNEVPIIYRF